MSEVKVNKVSPRSGTGLQLGDSGDTITIPSGATLTNNGTASGFASIDWQSTVVTGATHTASANQGIWINTTSNACNLTLPSSPSVGDQLIFSDFTRNWSTNAVTLTLNGSKYQGNTSPVPVYDTAGETVHIVYSGSTQGWIPINDGAVALETPQSYAIEYLVIAGGGAGSGSNHGAGGGAGGYRTATTTFTTGVTLTATVGDGGAGDNEAASGANGSDSSLAGSGFTTFTSTGGGGGGAGGPSGASGTGEDGGSGGGGGAYSNGDGYTNPGGSGNTPSTSPSQGNDGGSNGGYGTNKFPSGGGGGAGAAGQNAPANNEAGDGGAGTASTITGSSVTRAGGGGGGTYSPGTAGAGGAGGGGAGGVEANGTNGTANTGGGGGAGAGASPRTDGSGGKGVVILSMPDSDYSGTTTGSPVVATGVSGKTVLTFTGDGSYTA